MRRPNRFFFSLCATGVMFFSVLVDSAQASNISTTEKYAWSENTGWVNFRSSSTGVTVHAEGGYLSGYAWAENIGWIKLGSGSGPYANTSTNDWGVNLAGDGSCSGYAWSENTGWINFGPSYGGVTIDRGTGEFSGYAWGENIGWIKLRGTSPDYGVAYLVPAATNPPTINCPCPLGFIIGQTRFADVAATDEDGDLASLSLGDLPAGAVVTTNTVGGSLVARLTWTPGSDQYGIHPLVITATDLGGRTTQERSRLYVGSADDSLTSSNGIPGKMVRFTPVTNVAAGVTGAATVQWASVSGQIYDVYVSEQRGITADMSWSYLDEVTAAGTSASYVDAAAAAGNCVRHYQVVLDGENTTTNGIYSLNRCQSEAQTFQLMAPPVIGDKSFDGELGRVLAEALAGDAVGEGDKIHILQPDDSFRTLWLDANGVWREQDTGLPTTYALPAGQGFFVERVDGTSFTPVYDGQSGNSGTNTVAVESGWNILGISEGDSMPVQEAFESAAPTGGSAQEESDQVFVLNADGTWTHLMYVTGWGAPYDGNWVDLATFTITTLTLDPGEAVYYFRNGDGTQVDF